MAKKGGLGRGLDALFQDNDAQVGEGLMNLRISTIEPNKDQPRDRFDQGALSELADSIREHGVLQPIVVRSIPGGSYQIVAGERRWRASRMAGLSEIPAVVVEASDDKVMELALIENLQREDLTIIEEAMGYRTLMETYGFTQEQVAKRMGKSRPVIANALRILNLSPGALEKLEKGEITPGHGRVLAGLESHELMDRMAAETVKAGLTVRQLEKLAAQAKQEVKKPAAAEKPQEEDSAWGDSGYREVEISLGETLGRKVKVKRSPRGGVLEIEFYSLEDLKRLAEHIHWN
ncbi:MAG: ParB/RepB/Spo0J family partition protein [Angelakisella sp.]|jgi:ParB family chromosome partitioning protein|nr:ParB/RepB/Spo0J family partition protein [Angelakisella sp.]